jgi:hypothetical protein
VIKEQSLIVLGFIRTSLLSADLFDHAVQGAGVESLLKGYRAFFHQAGIFEKLDAGVAAVFASAAVNIPDS